MTGKTKKHYRLREEIDFFNYHALRLLEGLRNLSPTQNDIDTVEKFLRDVSKLAAINLNEQHLTLGKSQIRIGQFKNAYE